MSTCYAPVRRCTHLAVFSLDLHVLGTPPAFVLSQDQTLQLFFIGAYPALIHDKPRPAKGRDSSLKVIAGTTYPQYFVLSCSSVFKDPVLLTSDDDPAADPPPRLCSPLNFGALLSQGARCLPPPLLHVNYFLFSTAPAPFQPRSPLRSFAARGALCTAATFPRQVPRSLFFDLPCEGAPARRLGSLRRIPNAA